VNNEAVFEIAKMMKAMFLEKMGSPLCSWFPPGTVIIAAKAMVAISTTAIVHDLDVSFIHFLHLPSTSHVHQ